jgi:hypothetical protein
MYRKHIEFLQHFDDVLELEAFEIHAVKETGKYTSM